LSLVNKYSRGVDRVGAMVQIHAMADGFDLELKATRINALLAIVDRAMRGWRLEHCNTAERRRAHSTDREQPLTNTHSWSGRHSVNDSVHAAHLERQLATLEV
jgi:hypothetical protein